MRVSVAGVIVVLCQTLIGCGSGWEGGLGGLPGSDDSQSDGMGGDGSAEACNGFTELCDRRYSDVAFVTTHNAMSEQGWVPPNQNVGIVTQLEDGVRGLMIDLHYDKIRPGGDDAIYLCHGPCIIGRRRFIDVMLDIKAFMDANPREVITLILESYVSGDDVKDDLEDADLLNYVHRQRRSDPWPRLGEMIDSGRRLVLLTDEDDDRDWGYHDVWDYAWETDYDNKSIDDLDCEENRGDDNNRLFILNHFVNGLLGGSASWAERVNVNPFFINRARRCQQEAGQIPNFVTVDFYDVGDVMDVVRRLNGTIPG